MLKIWKKYGQFMVRIKKYNQFMIVKIWLTCGKNMVKIW